MAQAPSIPAWQLQTLQTLASQGNLSGVDPAILAAIDQAESAGEVSGAGINAEGYGGYFGLGAGTQYPGGASVSSATLNTNSPASFTAQAEVAADEFASLLQQTGGNVYAAESKYQGGSSEGTQIFSELGVPQSENTAVLTSWTSKLGKAVGQGAGAVVSEATGAGIPGVSTIRNAITGAVTGGAESAVSGLTSGLSKSVLSIVLTGVFVLGALGLIVLGLTRLFPGVSTTVTKALPLAAAA
ncbi:MAG: hypothetical protein FWC87_01080 [Acidimicrobiaceae bacterium]|nr:hypothetical protein [Acidimicrobiaceae bacterium]